MSDTPNVIVKINYVQNAEKISKNSTLKGQYGNKRAFYSCNNGSLDDHLRYVYKGTQEPNTYIEEDYVGYSGNSEKSSGVFDGKGMIDRNGRARLREKLRATESTIWHGLISFEEAFGKRYCADAKQAQRLMAIEMPKFFKRMGFNPDKIVWFAGLHTNTDNNHIHLSFFEAEPSRYTPHKKGLNYATGKIAGRHFERFKVAVEHRLTDISGEIIASRKDLTELSRNLLFTRTNKARYHDDLQKRLLNLTHSFPSSGRLAYDSENMRDLKPQIKEIVNVLMKSKARLYHGFEDFCSQVKDKDAQTIEMLTRNKIKKSDWPPYLIADKYLDDFYRRIGNQIISAVRVIKNREKKTSNRLANKRIRRRTVLAVMEYALKLESEIERDAMEAFDEFLERLENEKITIKGNYQSEMG